MDAPISDPLSSPSASAPGTDAVDDDPYDLLKDVVDEDGEALVIGGFAIDGDDDDDDEEEENEEGGDDAEVDDVDRFLAAAASKAGEAVVSNGSITGAKKAEEGSVTKDTTPTPASSSSAAEGGGSGVDAAKVEGVGVKTPLAPARSPAERPPAKEESPRSNSAGASPPEKGPSGPGPGSGGAAATSKDVPGTTTTVNGTGVVTSVERTTEKTSGGGSKPSGGKGGRIITPLDPGFEGQFTAPTATSTGDDGEGPAAPAPAPSSSDGGLFGRGMAASFKQASASGSALLARATATVTAASNSLQHMAEQSSSSSSAGAGADGGTVAKIPPHPVPPPPSQMADGVRRISALSGKFEQTSHQHHPHKDAAGAPQATAAVAANDTETQSRFIRAALGELLPGEKVIMFLGRVTHVADSASTASGVASSSSIASGVDVGGGGGGSGVGGGGGVGGGMQWCCVMTFYRVVLLNYTREYLESLSSSSRSSSPRLSSDGQRRPPAVDDDTAPGGPSKSPSRGGLVRKSSSGSSSGSVGGGSGLDAAVDRGGLSRQWQHCHARCHPSSPPPPKGDASDGETGQAADEESSTTKSRRPPSPPYRQHVLQMPLGSIDRVEKGSDMSNVSSLSVGGTPALGGSSSSSSSSAAGMAGAAIASGQNLTLVMYGKDGGRWMRFTTQSLGDCIRAHEALSTYAFPGRRNLGYLFAFESCREEIMNGSVRVDNRRFDPVSEYGRMGLETSPGGGGDPTTSSASPSSPWTLTRANVNYKVVPSYPSHLVVPNQAAEEVSGERGSRLLRQSAAFRSEGRVAALTWGTGRDAASLWRSSQPRVGLGSNRSPADEKYLACIADAARPFLVGGGAAGNRMVVPPAYARLLSGSMDGEGDVLSFLQMVGDGRNNGGSSGSAMGRGPAGGGGGGGGAVSGGGGVGGSPPLKIMDLRPKTSAMANRTQGYGYENTSNYTKCELSFFNIQNIHVMRDSASKLQALAQSPATNDVQWTGLVESTQWLSHCRYVLNASWYAAAQVHFHRLPVLVHCSHGWDRTSQVCAIAQLFLDSYYRTMRGFAVLVEKDFCSFGYPFHMRGGHGESRGSENGSNRSPVFLQFLDCVWQLVNLFPSFFEFNGRYLLAIADHIYSCRFGTLLCDNERERAQAGIYERTRSLWDHLDDHRGLFLNPTFHRVSDVFLPPLPCVLRRVTLWGDYHLRFGPKASMPCLPRELVPFAAASSYAAAHSRADASRSDAKEGGDDDDAMMVVPSELRVLHCARDEVDAALCKALHEADCLREKSDAQQIEIDRLRQLVRGMEIRLKKAEAEKDE